MTPDSMAVTARKSPGSWNRYTYVGGDPITYLDPGGRCEVFGPLSGSRIFADPWDCCPDDAWFCEPGEPGGGGGGGYPQVTCDFYNAIFEPIQLIANPAPRFPTFYYGIPVSLLFSATGGDGVYVWSELLQTVTAVQTLTIPGDQPDIRFLITLKVLTTLPLAYTGRCRYLRTHPAW